MQTRTRTEEHVALVTFGHECKVQQRLTNNFSKLRHTFGKTFNKCMGTLFCI